MGSAIGKQYDRLNAAAWPGAQLTPSSVPARSLCARRPLIAPRLLTLLTIELTIARMSNKLAPDVATVFGALADPARRQVVQLLGTAPLRAGELAAAVGMSAPAMSRHLKVLLQAGIVDDERTTQDARMRYFRLRPQSMAALQAWLDQLQAHWDEQLASFQRHIETRTTEERANDDARD
jgi:DNA-binding transcriptional ArsR family regulator